MAPTTPPISAWLELEGMPAYHVETFQMMAPARPAKITGRVTRSCDTMPLAIVAATESERKAPIRLRTAATLTAVRGLNAPVAIEVAMALAVSWKPFVKSKASAVPMTRYRMRLCTSTL